MRLRKWMFLITAAAFFISVLPGTSRVQASEQIQVFLNDQQMSFDVQPELKNDRTMVPFRAIFESLGASVNWDQQTQSVFGFGQGKSISLQLGNKYASANGKAVTLDAAPYIKQERTLVPLRFVSENLGAKVDWKTENGVLKVFIVPAKQNEISVPTQPQYTSDGKAIDHINVSGLFHP